MKQTKKKHFPASDISVAVANVLGTVPTLPGESSEQYQQGLQALIGELEAKTVMQVYLAEKIFECLWWMRRYEQQKQMTLIREMARVWCSGSSSKLTAGEAKVMELLMDPDRSKELNEILSESIYTEQTLLQEAFKNRVENISSYDKQTAILAKTLSGFQASYEVLTNRKLNIERLRLHNELLSRDLRAIELEALPDESQPKKARSK